MDSIEKIAAFIIPGDVLDEVKETDKEGPAKPGAYAGESEE
jgi:hypothetical protein